VFTSITFDSRSANIVNLAAKKKMKKKEFHIDEHHMPTLQRAA
jgi:hypothetical protein